MKQVALIIGFVTAIFLYGFSIQKNTDEIIWSKERKLTWEDFQGKTLNSSEFGAISI